MAVRGMQTRHYAVRHLSSDHIRRWLYPVVLVDQYAGDAAVEHYTFI